MATIIDKTIYVRGIEEHEAEKLSHSIRNYINENFGEIDHLLEFVPNPVYINITIDVLKPHPHHGVDLRIHGPHFEIIVKKDGPELYKIIDGVFDIAKNKIIEHKRKQVDQKRKNKKFEQD